MPIRGIEIIRLEPMYYIIDDGRLGLSVACSLLKATVERRRHGQNVGHSIILRLL